MASLAGSDFRNGAVFVKRFGQAPSSAGAVIASLTKRRGRMQDAVANAKRRLLDLIRWASPTLERVLPDLRTTPSLAALQRWVDPDGVVAPR
jgi:hypothetical protein